MFTLKFQKHQVATALWPSEILASSGPTPRIRFKSRLCCVYVHKTANISPFGMIQIVFFGFTAFGASLEPPMSAGISYYHPRRKGFTFLQHDKSKAQTSTLTVKAVLNIRKHATCQYAALNLYFHMEIKFYPYTPF